MSGHSTMQSVNTNFVIALLSIQCLVNAYAEDITCPTKPFLARPEGDTLIIPDGGKLIPYNYDCTYHIEAPKDYVIRERFKSFKLNTDYYCPRMVGIGRDDDPTSRSEYQQCGNFILPIPEYFQNRTKIYMRLKGTGFTADHMVALRYWAVSMIFACPKKSIAYRDIPNEVSFPAPGMKFPKKIDCKFTIYSTGMQLLNVRFKSLHIDPSISCLERGVAVSRGPSPGYWEEKWRCGYEVPKFYLHQERAITVHIQGFHFTEKDRFTLSLK